MRLWLCQPKMTGYEEDEEDEEEDRDAAIAIAIEMSMRGQDDADKAAKKKSCI